MSHPIDVFIAHAGADKTPAIELHRALTTLGIAPFVDALDLLPGDEWDLELPKAQRRAAVTAILIGGVFEPAYYLREEVASGIAYARADAAAHRVVPVYLMGLPTSPDGVPYGLRVRNAVDWRGLGGAVGVAAELARLFPSARSFPPLAAAAPPTLNELTGVERFDVLSRLLPGLFGEVLLRIGAPTREFPSEMAAPSLRALSVVQWIELQSVATRLRFDALLREKAPGSF